MKFPYKNFCYFFIVFELNRFNLFYRDCDVFSYFSKRSFLKNVDNSFSENNAKILPCMNFLNWYFILFKILYNFWF